LDKEGLNCPFFFAFNLTKQKLFYCIYMIVLQNTSDSQTFNFIPRSYTQGTTYTIKITNETTNTEIYSSTSTSFTANDYYYQHSDTFTLVEDTMYNLEIKAGSELIFRDKIFCTNQTVSTYSVNNNAYTENSIDNDFIVL
jgi:hypothetical protein